MAEYLLKEGYKDPAAVLVGGVLEEHLRKLCLKNNITAIDPKDGKPRKSSVLNDDIAKAKIYDRLEQKSVTAWLRSAKQGCTWSLHRVRRKSG